MLRLTLIASILCFALGQEVDERVIQGTNIQITDFPFLVSLQNRGVHYCGGSIISRKVCLTAAHCVHGVKNVRMNYLTARVGTSMWRIGGQVKNVIEMITHPKYNHTTKYADVGLVLLQSPIDLNSGAQIIPLADGIPVDGSAATIAGFGVTDPQGFMIPTILQSADVAIVSKSNCSSSLWGYGDAIKSTMFCAMADGKDACQGDSGGPLVSKKSRKQWGIVSWGSGCAQANFPGVYCAIAPYKDWITTNAKRLESQ